MKAKIVAWVARDYHGELYLYKKKPKLYGCLYSVCYNSSFVTVTLTPADSTDEITFENSPKRVKLCIEITNKQA